MTTEQRLTTIPDQPGNRQSLEFMRAIDEIASSSDPRAQHDSFRLALTTLPKLADGAQTHAYNILIREIGLLADC